MHSWISRTTTWVGVVVSAKYVWVQNCSANYVWVRSLYSARLLNLSRLRLVLRQTVVVQTRTAHLMCLVYIRCLFCEASRTSSIGCFVCDLHRFSIKLNGSVKHWKTWYAYFKYTTRMGYVPPPRRLRYRTNLFVIVGLVQRIDDVS